MPVRTPFLNQAGWRGHRSLGAGETTLTVTTLLGFIHSPNTSQYHFGVSWKYVIPRLCKEYGTTIHRYLLRAYRISQVFPATVCFCTHHVLVSSELPSYQPAFRVDFRRVNCILPTFLRRSKPRALVWTPHLESFYNYYRNTKYIRMRGPHFKPHLKKDKGVGAQIRGF